MRREKLHLRAEGGWRLARDTARLRGVRGALWPSSSCSFPVRVFFSPTTAVQHPRVPIVSRVPSPGLLLGAASPYTLQCELSASAGGERTGQPNPSRVHVGVVFPSCSLGEDRQEKAAPRAPV